MAENGNKKRRIARIGRISSGTEATKLSCDEGLIQADCNLVYDIMESMNKSQNVKSIEQLQEFCSNEKSSRTNNSASSSSCKHNSKMSSSKQMKKFDSGKKYPLMAKCQQTMKNLKKNRSMPKPRAHVGPSQTPISRLQSNNLCNNQTISNIALQRKECPIKISENSKKNRCSPELHEKAKKVKTAHSVDKFSDTNTSQTESFNKEPRFIGDTDTDSDNEFEQFIQKHHPENSARRKTSKNNKLKKKRSKQLVCAMKVSKVTRRTLSASESEVDHNTEINREEVTSKRYQRIVSQADDDSATDCHVNDSGTLNFDSFSSSEDENIVNKNAIDCIVNRLGVFPEEQSSVISSSISSHKPKVSQYWEGLKLKCKIPCFVRIKRDPSLDKRAASLYIDNPAVSNTVSVSPDSNTVSVSNSNDDEDDCIIINETANNNFAGQNSEKHTPALENTILSKSPSVSKASTSIEDVQNRFMLNEKRIFNPTGIQPRTEKSCNEKSVARLDPKNVQKEVSSVSALRRSLSDTENYECNNENSTECADKSGTVASPLSQMLNFPNNENDVSLNRDTATTATEKEMFNVQILSVKSLNDADIVVLSDDDEEEGEVGVPTLNETEVVVPTVNETKERVEDSDIEIICLNSSIARTEKCGNENNKDDLNSETHSKVNGMNENSSSSSSQPLASVENDCIILDDIGKLSEKNCTVKDIGVVQPSSQLVETLNNETTNSSKSVKIDSDKEAILKTLGTIDINCIKKVIRETTAADTRKESIAAKAGNSFSDNIEISERAPDSIPAKQKRSQNDTCLTQEQTSIDASIAPIRSFNVNNEISSLNTSAIDTHGKHSELVQNSIVQNMKSSSENVPSSKNWNSNKPSSNNCDEISVVCIKSSANNAAPKSFVSKKEIVAFSQKTEQNALLRSQKNQVLPMCTKMESYQNPSDELDNIAAKSINDLNENEKNSIVPLLELYRAEYERFINIKSTGHNVSAGLKLLEEKQARKLLAISSSIKNIVKKDVCFHRINNECARKRKEPKSDSAEKNESSEEIKKPSGTSNDNHPDLEKDDKVKIFNESVVKTASEYLKSAGPSSSQEVYNHLINSVCAECGKLAVAACLGCAKVYYCSEKCGLTHWNNGHYETCMR